MPLDIALCKAALKTCAVFDMAHAIGIGSEVSARASRIALGPFHNARSTIRCMCRYRQPANCLYSLANTKTGCGQTKRF